MPSLKRKWQYPPNINHETQKFHSTQMKRQKLSLTLSKPSKQDLQRTVNTLHKQLTHVCGVCFKEDDISSAITVAWIQCSIMLNVDTSVL